MRSTSCEAGGVAVCADRIGGRGSHAHRMATGPMQALPVPSAGIGATSRMPSPSVRRYTPLTSASGAAAGSMVKGRYAPCAGHRENSSEKSLFPGMACMCSTDVAGAGTDLCAGSTMTAPPAVNKKGDGRIHVPIVQLLIYVSCSGVRRSIERPSAASFSRATPSSMTAGTSCTPGARSLPRFAMNSAERA